MRVSSTRSGTESPVPAAAAPGPPDADRADEALAAMSGLAIRLFAVGSEIAVADSLLDHDRSAPVDHAVHRRLERAVVEIDAVISDLRSVVAGLLVPAGPTPP